MITSIIATKQTLCYLLEIIQRQRSSIRRLTLLPSSRPHDAFRPIRLVVSAVFLPPESSLQRNYLGLKGILALLTHRTADVR
jgi:hypothetical protein